MAWILFNQESKLGFKMTYPDHRRGITYRIIGFIGEDSTYESYHGRCRKPVSRDVILHLLKNGNGRRFNVKNCGAVVVNPTVSASTRETQVLPWKREGTE